MRNHILIVGMGPVGLLLACKLSLNEYLNITIIDGESESYITREYYQASFLHKKSVDILSTLNLWEEIKNDLNFNFDVKYFIQEKCVYNNNFNKFGCAIFSHYKLIQSLLKECKSKNNIKIVFNAKINKIINNSNGTINANFIINNCEDLNILSFQTPKTQETYYSNNDINSAFEMKKDANNYCLYEKQYEYIFGCDGAKSTVRKLMGCNFTYKEGKKWTVYDFHIPDIGNKIKGMNWFIDENPCMYISCNKDHFRFETYCENNIETNFQNINNYLTTKYIPYQIISLLNKTNLIRTSTYTMYNNISNSFQSYNNNIFLVGDSAHTIVPFSGMGVTIGFEDVIYITNNFNNLTMYTDDRRKKIINYQKRASFLDIIIHLLINQNTNKIYLKILSTIIKCIVNIIKILPYFLNKIIFRIFQNYILHI